MGLRSSAALPINGGAGLPLGPDLRTAIARGVSSLRAHSGEQDAVWDAFLAGEHQGTRSREITAASVFVATIFSG